jgi:hypothetical protein
VKPQDIHYQSDVPTRWCEALDSSLTAERLEETLHEWRELFPDAWDARPTNSVEFDVFRAGLKKERGSKGHRRAFAGAEWCERFGAIMLPALLLQVGEVALRFQVPWGTAYIRMQEAKNVEL